MALESRRGKAGLSARGRSLAFLLRCWQEPDGDGELAWRFSLTHINHQHERKGFANLEALETYLEQMLKTFDR